MNYPYRMKDDAGVVHIVDDERVSSSYMRCERRTSGTIRGSLRIVGDVPTCLWCMAR